MADLHSVEQVTLADLREKDVVWVDDGFYPVLSSGIYPESCRCCRDDGYRYVGYTIDLGDRRARLTGVPSNPILRAAMSHSQLVSVEAQRDRYWKVLEQVADLLQTGRPHHVNTARRVLSAARDIATAQGDDGRT